MSKKFFLRNCICNSGKVVIKASVFGMQREGMDAVVENSKICRKIYSSG